MNARDFWARHDRQIPSTPLNGYDGLQHSLYRGMPRWFNAFFDAFQVIALRKLLRKVEIGPDDRILDLGCGIGRWSTRLNHLSRKYIGLDPGMNALAYARATQHGAIFVNGFLPDLPFASHSCGFAFSVYVLQHVPFDAQYQAISEISRILKPNGYLAVCESIDERDQSSHVFSNAYPDWKRLFTEAGFTLVAEQGTEYIPYVKMFHAMRGLIGGGKTGRGLDVISVARLLAARPLLSLAIRAVLYVSYPVEWLMMTFMPAQWAKSACFVWVKS